MSRFKISRSWVVALHDVADTRGLMHGSTLVSFTWSLARSPDCPECFMSFVCPCAPRDVLCNSLHFEAQKSHDGKA